MTAAAEASALRHKRRAENFPVALWALPPGYRRDLVAIYDVVRVIDDLGDQAAGDRTLLLKDFAADLALLWTGGRAAAETARRLRPVVARRRLSRRHFDDLVEANLLDQRFTTYETYDDLLGYCTLSAAPVGRLVLEVFDRSEPGLVALSDRICMALQLLEHWQDVVEDRAAGRTYLPQEDLRRFGVTDTDLAGAPAGRAVRGLIRFETERASELLESGVPLVGHLTGWPRLTVAGYVAGGRATVDALRRVDGDVLSTTPRPRPADVVRHLARLAVGRAP